MSTIYYAFFHELASTCAFFLMGSRPTGHGRRAWQQAYRALEHKRSNSKCKNKEIIGKFPIEISNFANQYVSLQEKRHQADYDPLVDVTLTDASVTLHSVGEILEKFRNANEMDRRAFCVFVLFENRDDPARKAEEKERERTAAEQRRQQQISNKDNQVTT